MLVSGIYSQADDIMGKAGRPYVPLIFGIGAYVAVSNLMGLIPGLAAPTANMNTTAAPAICVFIFYNYIGFKKHGLGYIKHFMGPVIWLAPFMFIIEFELVRMLAYLGLILLFILIYFLNNVLNKSSKRITSGLTHMPVRIIFVILFSVIF